MKVCYVWIEKFRNFENFCLNLSSKLKFNYDRATNKLGKIETGNVPVDFFGKRITDVTALIGRNGSGKSNALELICMMLKGAKSRLSHDFFVITQEGNELTCHCHFATGKKFPKTTFPITFTNYSGSLLNLKVVYFSNVFDQRFSNFDSSISDISANREFLRPSMKFTQQSRVKKQISFINSKAFQELEIDIPKQIIVTLRAVDNRFRSSSRIALYGEKYKIFGTLRSRLRSRLKDLNPESRFISILRFRYFFEILEEFFRAARDKESNTIENFIQSAIELMSSVEAMKTDDITTELLNFIQHTFTSNLDLIKEIERREYSDFNFEKSIKRLHFLQKIRRETQNLNIEYYREGRSKNAEEGFIIDFTPSFNKNFWIDFSILFDQYCQTRLDWLGISSGHQAFMNLFSSIYTELKYSKSENLLLCIDEGDLYLHPKWQQEFFYKLVTILPKICNNKIQLVLTSHSPFLISDLPKNNITVLDPESENHSVDGIKLKKNTFGANLYDLYGDAFFLGKSKISTFAYNKIKDLIKEVESGDTENIEVEYLINILGDEVLSFNIKNMINK